MIKIGFHLELCYSNTSLLIKNVLNDGLDLSPYKFVQCHEMSPGSSFSQRNELGTQQDFPSKAFNLLMYLDAIKIMDTVI